MEQTLGIIGIVFSFFSLFWIITNARINEIVKRLERIEEVLLYRKKKKKIAGDGQINLLSVFFLIFKIILYKRKLIKRIRFYKNKHSFGEVDDRGRIYINFRKHKRLKELRNTILHEFIHLLKPAWSEESVYKTTKIIEKFFPTCFLLPVIDKYLQEGERKCG